MIYTFITPSEFGGIKKYMNTTYENSVQRFEFTIRNQPYTFNTRDEYLEAFSKALDIAKEQTLLIEHGVIERDSEGVEYLTESQDSFNDSYWNSRI